VFKVAAAYIIVGWLIMQAGEVMGPALHLPEWVNSLLAFFLILGFPMAMFFAWAFEMTPEGLKKEKEVDHSQSVADSAGQKLNYAIMGLLALAVVYFVFDKFVTNPQHDTGITQTTQTAIDEIDVEADLIEPDPDKKSIAVLPFTTRSTSEDDKFFSDGMHDDLLTQLAKIGSLKVISRTSMMEYRETTKNLRQIGEELGVANILEGAVQRVGKQVRINVQLIDARTDEHLWAETYDREMSLDNLLSIQGEMSRSIAQAMEATLSPQEEALIDRRLTDNLEALEAYRRAKSFSGPFIAKDLDRAELELKQALKFDPEFAAAWAMLAHVNLSRYWGVENLDQYRVQARKAIDSGRAIDPDLPELDIAEGYYYYWGFQDYPAALEVLEPVLEIYPNDVELNEVLALVNRRYGRFDTSLDFMFRVLALAPRDQQIIYSLGETYSALRQFDKAQSYLDKLVALNPASPRLAHLRAQILGNRDGDFLGSARNFQLASIDLQFLKWNVWTAFNHAGDYEASMAFLAEQQEEGMPGWKSSRQLNTVPILSALTMFYAEDPAAIPSLNEVQTSILTALEAHPEEFEVNLLQCLVSGALGEPSTIGACEAAIRVMRNDAFDRPWEMVSTAQGFALGGHSDRALDILQEVLESPIGPATIDIKANPAFRSLHESDRWQALMRQHGAKP
jgi:TolB-like protein/Tfp pilus assembly protein PilF